MASLGRVVAGVAHEINTSIGVILTAMSSLKDEIDMIGKQLKENKINKHNLEEFMSYSAEVCQLSLENIQRAAHLIDSFKQVAVDQEKDNIELFFIKSCIENTLLNIKARFKDKSITYSIDCDSELEINSFQSAFMQIITNLANNSCIHGFAKQTEGEIRISCSMKDDYLLLNYSDNGVGLNEDGKKNIFEPFYTTNRGMGGSGLGSHLVYNLVTQLLHGEINIDPEIKQGLGFNIKIPLDAKFNSTKINSTKFNSAKPDSSHYSI